MNGRRRRASREESVSKHQIQPEYGDEQADAGRDAEPVSRDQILRCERREGNIHFLCSADHEQDWQPYPVDPYSAICDDYTYIHNSIGNKPITYKESKRTSVLY